jgi:hypothetical protein
MEGKDLHVRIIFTFTAFKVLNYANATILLVATSSTDLPNRIFLASHPSYKPHSQWGVLFLRGVGGGVEERD